MRRFDRRPDTTQYDRPRADSSRSTIGRPRPESSIQINRGVPRVVRRIPSNNEPQESSVRAPVQTPIRRGPVIVRPPAAGRVVRPPSAGRVVRPPSAGRVVRPPSAGRVVRPPSAGRVVRPPPAGRVVRPPAGRVVRPPPAGRVVRSPPNGRVVRPPAAGRVVRPPAAGRVVRPPSAGRVVRPPSAGRVVRPTIRTPVRRIPSKEEVVRRPRSGVRRVSKDAKLAAAAIRGDSSAGQPQIRKFRFKKIAQSPQPPVEYESERKVEPIHPIKSEHVQVQNRDIEKPLENDLDGKELIVKNVKAKSGLPVQPISHQYGDIWNLSDMAYTYPDITDPNFQSELSAKLEFRSLRNDGREPIPQRGEFFSHQEFIHRFLQIYDRVLLMHPTGSGKTCSAGGSAEQLKRNFMRGTIDYVTQYLSAGRNRIKHVFILVPGKVITSEFKRQLLCKCSQPGDYDLKKINDAETAAAATTRINQALNPFYTIIGYAQMAKKMNGKTDAKLRAKYSDSMFIVDEANKLSVESDDYSRIKEVNKKGPATSATNIDGTKKKSTAISKQLTYNTLQHTFQLIERSKVVVMTATPMVNSVTDFNFVMNLVLPKNKLLPDEDLSKWSVERLRPYLQGHVSYVPDIDINVDIVEDGYPLSDFIGPNDRTTNGKKYKTMVYPGIMRESGNLTQEPYQGDVYKTVALTGKLYRFYPRQAGDYVYPDGSFTSKGFNKYIKDPENLRSLLPLLRINDDPDRDELSKSSIKYAQLVWLIKHHVGKYYCFSNFKEGSGIVVLGKALLANGFKEYTGLPRAFRHGQKGATSYCQDEDTSKRSINLEKTPRFALITSDVPEGKQNAIKELYNSKENMHGEYIKVILMTPVARFGLNLYDTTAISIIEPSWNEANNYQAITRALRVAGFENLLEEKRQVIRLENEKEILLARAEHRTPVLEDPKSVRIKVILRRHVSIDNEGQSIDVNLYLHSEDKAIAIEELEFKVKQLSIDCSTHQLRQKEHVTAARVKHLSNIFPCWDTESLPIDDRSYNVMYSEPNIRRAMVFIKDHFKINNTAHITDLFDMYKALGMEILKDKVELQLVDYLYSPKFVVKAADRIISGRVDIRDRFGFTRYLHNDGDLLFLISSYPIPGSNFTPLSAHYVDELNGVPINNIDDFVREIGEPEQNSIIEEIIHLQGEFDTLVDLTMGLSSDGKAKLVEWAISNLEKLDQYPVIENIIEIFAHNITTTRYPVGLIEIIHGDLNYTGPKQGRPSHDPNEIKRVFTPEQLDRDISPENFDMNRPVYLHDLYGTGKTGTQHSLNADYLGAKGRIRIYDNGKWKDGDAIEENIYRAIIVNDRRITSDNYGMLYGKMYMNPRKFSVVSHIYEKPGTRGNGQTEYTGRKCESLNADRIIGYLVHSGAIVPDQDIIIPNDDNVKEYLQSKFKPDILEAFDKIFGIVNGHDEEIGKSEEEKLKRMRQAYAWHYYYKNQNLTKFDLCEKLKERFIHTRKMPTI
jgi:type III restriction/modification enzyme restriction subunit/helicase-like protein